MRDPDDAGLIVSNSSTVVNEDGRKTSTAKLTANLTYSLTAATVSQNGEYTPGAYYLYVKDEAGNVKRSSQTQSVYTVGFSGNGGTPVSGELPILLKAQNSTLTLPAIADSYTKDGHDFLYWSGATDIYPDKAGYTVNAKDTLAAIWYGQMFDYTVNYYVMDVNGEYQSDGTGAFTAVYGSTVSASDIAVVPQGFSLDREKSTAITIAGNEQSLDVITVGISTR